MKRLLKLKLEYAEAEEEDEEKERGEEAWERTATEGDAADDDEGEK